ncbi:MAG: DUF3791 domain-containing protein [Clostridia bacterium]|nr:DUF3791 domain-containing protein [Clostridia bacterium]
MNANPILLQKKYARVVNLLSEKTGATLDESLKTFYSSMTYRLMREGVSDMHCMSDEYLAEEIFEEGKEETNNA